MISVTYDHGGAITGITINETTYSLAALADLVQEIERLRTVEVAATALWTLKCDRPADYAARKPLAWATLRQALAAPQAAAAPTEDLR